MLGELAEESPLRAHGLTTSQGSEREPLHELWITEKVRMSLRSKIASREQDLPVSRSSIGHDTRHRPIRAPPGSSRRAPSQFLGTGTFCWRDTPHP